MSWRKVKIGEVLKQYRIETRVQNDINYKQVSILNDGSVVLRGEKIGREIGRKRQFLIDLNKFPKTLIFTRQLLLQGSIGLASEEVHNCIVTENMPMFSVVDTKIDVDFLIQFIKSKEFKNQVGRIELTGSAQKSIHEKTFLQLEIPLPSLTEQKGIVSLLKNRNSKVEAISNELSNQLTLVKKLRQQLLQDAVKGKLSSTRISDDLNDEHDLKQKYGEVWNMNGKELLEHIKAEKEKSAKSGKSKKSAVQTIKTEEIPFEIPVGWVWCRLGEICDTIFDGPFGSHLKSSDYTNSGVRVVRLQNLGYMKFKEEKESFVSIEKYETIKQHEVFEGDVIIGSFLADGINCVVLPKLNYTAIAKADCFTIRIKHKMLLNHFVMFLLSSPLMFIELSKLLRGMTRLRINTTQLKQIPIPLPPFPEQQQIVQKLNELMQTCEALEASIKESASQNEKLLQQVLREALRKSAL